MQSSFRDAANTYALTWAIKEQSEKSLVRFESSFDHHLGLTGVCLTEN